MSYRGRRSPGYTDDFQAQREADERERERQEAANRKENERLRAAHRQGLADERQAARDRAHEQDEARLAPEKERRMRAWLIDHPDHTSTDFERHAWPLIREELTGSDAIKHRYLAQATGGGTR